MSYLVFYIRLIIVCVHWIPQYRLFPDASHSLCLSFKNKSIFGNGKVIGNSDFLLTIEMYGNVVRHDVAVYPPELHPKVPTIYTEVGEIKKRSGSFI